MKIGFVKNIPTPYGVDFFKYFNESADIDLTLYYCSENFEWRNWEADPRGFDNEILSGWNLRSFVFNPKIINKILDEELDVLIIGGYAYPTALLALFSAKAKGIPVLLRVESHLQDNQNRNRSIISRTFKSVILKGLFKIPDGIVVAGTAARQYVENYGVSPQRIFESPPPCNVERFRKAADLTEREVSDTRETFNIREDKIVLFVGRLAEKKGVDVLLDAFEDIDDNDSALVIVGDGPLRDVVVDAIEKSNQSNIYWIGYQPDEMLPKLYAISDLLVCPSYGDQWALVVHEAMACSLPVVATETVGAALDLINDKQNGRIIQSGDPAALTEALNWFFSSPMPSEELGKNASLMAEKFDYDKCVDGYLDAVEFVTKDGLT